MWEYIIMHCYGLNVCTSSKFIFWNVHAQGDGIRRWDLPEGLRSWQWSSHEWNQCLEKRLQRDPWPCSPCQDTVTWCWLWIRKRTFTRGSHADTLILTFQPPALWEKILLFISYQSVVVLLEQLNAPRHTLVYLSRKFQMLEIFAIITKQQ